MSQATPSISVRAYLGLGANMGEPKTALKSALSALNDHPQIAVRRVSSLYLTAPIGDTAQPDFLNAVAEIETELPPEGLLAATLHIENLLGRKRTNKWGPRVIDIDVLLYAGQAISSGELSIPHPRMYERAFVLVPLAELAPDLEIPVTATDTYSGETLSKRAERLAKGTRIEKTP